MFSKIKIEPQPPIEFIPVQVSNGKTHSWCLRNQSKFDLPRSKDDWLTIRKPVASMDAKLIDGVWYWVLSRKE